jgi:hypothetical protein
MSEEYLPYVELVEDLIRPLSKASDSTEQAEDLLRELGYAPPSEVLAFGELAAAVNAVSELIDAIRAAVASDDRDALFKHLLEFVVEAGRAVKGLNSFQAKIQTNFAGSPFLAVTDILATIPTRLIDYLLVKYLEDYRPTVFAALLLVGVVDLEDIDDAPTPFVVPYRKRTVNWNQLGDLFTDPLKALKDNFDGGDELLYERVLYLMRELGLGLGLMPSYGSPHPATLGTMNRGADLRALDAAEELPTLYFPVIADPTVGVGFDLYPLLDPATQKYTGLALALRLAAALEFPLSAGYRLQIKVSANVKDGLGVRLARGESPSFVSSLFGSPAELAAAIEFGAKFSVVPTEVGPSGKLVALGAPGGSRFEIGSGALAFGIEKLDTLDIFVEGDLKDGVIALKADNPDGFIAKILPPDGINANFSLGLGVSNRAGLYFKGSSSLVIRVPLHIALGPIEINNLGIALKLEQGAFPLTVTSGLSAKIGPLAAVVEDVGVRATFKVKGDNSGNLGPFDVTFGFKPPNGVGLSIDAGVVKGGGYLYFNFDDEEYAGALELTISDFLSLKAIGLITTRMPDGSHGFSMIIIITAEFSPGLQLGYGFVLIGVGGLLGLNRTVVLDALAKGVRTGAVNGILFPVDPVANAPRIISDLRTIFPPAANRFLIGPMAKLGWGTPTLVSLALGVIIEIPGNVAILGVLKVVLPDEEADLLRLQVNFVGAIEFDKKRGWFFAALFESRVLFITLEGEMGMLIALGADANFVLSVGGFHPRFTPPPLPFPSPKRLQLNILDTAVCRIRADAYFAVTTNTAQFGAHAQLFFGYDSFSVEGHIGLDALMRFSPFYFIVQVSAGVSLKVFGVGAFGIDLDFTLEGTTPWRARGHGSISLLFFSVSKSFDETWGESVDTTLPPIMVVPLLQAELAKSANWRALPPPSANLLVSLRNMELDSEVVVLHPLGTLEVSQNQIPLALELARVGAQKPADADRFELRVTSVGLAKRNDARRPFSPAQFRNLTDAQKLSSSAYQSEVSGIELGIDGADLRVGRAVQRIVRYEVSTIDTLYRRHKSRFLAIGRLLFDHLARGAAASKTSISVTRRKQLQPFDDGVTVRGERYGVAFTKDNRPAAAGAAAFATEGAARDWLANAVAADPALEDTLHVVPSEELVAA